MRVMNMDKSPLQDKMFVLTERADRTLQRKVDKEARQSGQHQPKTKKQRLYPSSPPPPPLKTESIKLSPQDTLAQLQTLLLEADENTAHTWQVVEGAGAQQLTTTFLITKVWGCTPIPTHTAPGSL